SDEMPPPIPSSWRPYGSGLPRAVSKMWSRAGPDAGRSPWWKTRQRLGPPRMEAARIFFWLTDASPSRPSRPRVGENAAGQQYFPLARREHARGRERGARARVDDRDPLARRQLRAQPGQAQAIVALDAGPRRRIGEDERDH